MSITQSRKDFYEHSMNIWNNIGNLSAKAWMDEYDYIFKFVIQDEFEHHMSKSKIVYDVYSRIFREQAKVLSREDYASKVAAFCRFGAYLTRFYIPKNELKSFERVAIEAYNEEKGL